MKRTIISVIAALLACLGTNAQGPDTVIETIKAKCAGRNCQEGPFVETRINSAGKTDAVLKGDLCFTGPDVFSMIYSSPSGDYFMISGNVMKTKVCGAETVYDLKKNVMMRYLSHILLYSFSGRISDLVGELDADIKSEKSGGGYCVTLSAKKKSTRGFSSVQIFYDSSCILNKMIMNEWTGRSTIYEMVP